LRLTRLAFLLAEARWEKVWRAHGIFQPTKKDKAFNQAEVSAHLHSLNLKEDIAIACDADEAKKVCGISQSGVWISRGATLNLSDASKDMLRDQEGLICIWNTQVARLEEREGVWCLLNSNDQIIVTANQVVIAAGLDSRHLINSLGVRLPLRPVRGQLSIFLIKPNDPWVAKLPKVGISGDGYCLPAERLEDGSYHWIVGSSFD
jgi:tRNA 5-methylaminomethyl-2-thiouridine biosynthesis bifunctional protein